MSIRTAQELHRIFHYRHIEHIKTEEFLTIIENNHKTYVQVYDTNLTRNLLESKKLFAFNYYHAGMQRLKKNCNENISELENFWETSLLFINEQPHKELKLQLKKEISSLENYLLANKTNAFNYLDKFKTISDCPIGLSVNITNIIGAYLISAVTKICFEKTLNFILMREPVFYSYFHTPKQLAMGKNLTNFFSQHHLNQLDPAKKILIQTIILMGLDPIVGMLCTKQLTGISHYLEIPIVSYITRVSKDEITVLGHNFKPGTIFNLSLVPNMIQYETKNYESINFGFGTHKCLGIQLTKIIIDLALEYIERNPAKKINGSEFKTRSEGTFLKFSRT